MIKTIYSIKTTSNEIIDDLKQQASAAFGDNQVKMVLFFSTSKTDVTALSAGLKGAFADANVFGCTTAGELVTGQMLKNSVVAMIFDAEAIEESDVRVVESVKEGGDVSAAFAAFKDKFGVSVNEMDPKKYVGIILIDGLSGAEEKVMDNIGDLTNVHFIGASAGDDLAFKTTLVCANGKTYENAAVLAIIKPTKGFEILKTQSFAVREEQLVASKVDEANREVLEFNNKPANEAYAEVLKVSVDEAANMFMTNPVGLMVDGEPFVKSPQRFVDSKMKFYCNVKEGAKLSLLQSEDIVVETEKTVNAKLAEMGDVSGIINFNCILRTLELEKKNQTEAYGKLFTKVPTVGFSTYGEEYVGHINQTSIILMIK
jgi:hypothetical protein